MMYWQNWADFLSMGKHGFYVWSCVLAMVLCIGLEVVFLSKARRQALKKLNRLNQVATRSGTATK